MKLMFKECLSLSEKQVKNFETIRVKYVEGLNWSLFL